MGWAKIPAASYLPQGGRMKKAGSNALPF